MKHQTLIFATFLAPVLYKTCLYITEYIERCLDIPTFLLSGEDLADFAEGAIDGGFISSMAYVHLVSQQPAPVELVAMPVLQTQGADHQYSPHSISDIVVRRGSMFSALEDLQGCVWASCIKGHYEKPPYGDYQFAQETFFEQVPRRECIITSSHLQSLRLLLDGTVEAAAIDTHLLNEILEYSTKMRREIRVIGSFNTTTVPPVVTSAQVDPVVKRGIREALLSIHQNQFYAQRLHEGAIERFLPVTDEHYQPMRERYGLRVNSIVGEA